MSTGRSGFFQRILDAVLNLGADPADDEYTRTIKRIYWVSAVIGISIAAGASVGYFLAGDPKKGWLFLSSFVFLGALFILGIRHPKHFQRVALALLVYFVVGSPVVTVLMGGFWATDGGIMVGLLGPVMGLVFLRDRRPAIALFLVYSAIVLTLAIVWAPLEARPGLAPVKVWLAFLIVGAFIFGVMYFFVVQREKAHRLLAAEKAKSESLLKRIQADLEQAARIQRDLLPKASPLIEGYDVAGVNIPCYEIGGDYYDLIDIAVGRLGLVIADVSGKGISASLLMASLRAALLAEVRSGHPPDQLAARLSDFVHDSSGPSSFVTFFFGELETGTGELCYVNAGHNPPFILDRAGSARALEASGLPLGMFAKSKYEARTIGLRPGELAVLYTDGIPEGRNSGGELYSEKRLIDLVRADRDLPAEQICRNVLGNIQGYVCGTQPCDDVTLVVVKRLAGT